MARILDKLATVLRLGPRNVARVAAYRIGLRSGWHPVLKIHADVPEGPFFDTAAPKSARAIARESWRETMPYFSAHAFALPSSGTPDWFANPFRQGARGPAKGAWHSIPDFNPEVGDIKTVWEASRFDWVIPMAQRAAKGDSDSLARLNAWITDWIAQNPPYQGSNWKCGQEASLRVLHLVAGTICAGQGQPPKGLEALIDLHLRRIAPTIDYAIGQSNNHGTSEAAALFVGGTFLGGSDGDRWAATGRKWLEERAQTLIEADGTFCQYSVIYHRLMLETYSFVEAWRRHRGLPDFSPKLHARLRAATHWLYSMTCPLTGQAPNLGANDGARILAFTDAAYGDMRPTLQLAAALFLDARVVEDQGIWDQPAIWLDVPAAKDVLPPTRTTSFDQGGFHVLQQGDTRAILRYPRFRFRPSQADALHVDLWHAGRNLLRDAGSFSYAATEMEWAAGTSAHNTATFDGRDQMPRLGRFLFGKWLKATGVEKAQDTDQGATAAAGYQDGQGASHHRKVTLTEGRLQVEDVLAGNAKQAVLRWRVPQGRYTLTSDGIEGEGITICVRGDTKLHLDLKESWESLHYLEKSDVQVLEVSCAVPARVSAEVLF